MKKILSAVILHALLLPSLKAQSKLFDQQVRLKTCNISIEANMFTARTFIEMEFYNPADTEVEGLQNFELNKGQVVSAFQLELNGTYRDASIEERWKAVRAYSSIVGKRVDPAILQMSYNNNYSLRIYPIPAHASRKVTMTIDQVLPEENDRLTYSLPLSFTSITDSFQLKVSVSSNGRTPVCGEGLLKKEIFQVGEQYHLKLAEQNIKLNRQVVFSIPVEKNSSTVCISKNNGVNNFVARIYPELEEYYSTRQGSVAVFWDVSKSSSERDIRKELDFLQRYLSANNIKAITITLFNQQVQGRILVNVNENNFTALRNFLSGYYYTGATSFEELDLSSAKADVVLIFSDGKNSLGSGSVKPATVQVNCIVSSPRYDRMHLNNIIGNTGGSIIDLNLVGSADAVQKMQQARNFLLRYHSKNNSVKLNEKFPLNLGNGFLLSGTFEGNDELQLEFGNSGAINKIMSIPLKSGEDCANRSYSKLQMLRAYDTVVNWRGWENMVYFGIKEKVVTPQTAFLVLEKIEDYIKYNIAPPPELEEECAARNYVYRSEYKIRALKSLSKDMALQDFVSRYNVYVKWWNKEETMIDLARIITPQQTESSSAEPVTNGTGQTKSIEIPEGSNSLKEVIVTSAFSTTRTLRSQSSNVQYIRSEQLTTARNYDINNALAGKVAGLQVRSQSEVKLGATTTIRIRGENGLTGSNGPLYVVDGLIFSDPSDINVDDIDNVTVLQGPAAAALFGPGGANGAIVIVNKKGKNRYYNYYYSNYNWREYKLKNLPDVEYLDEIKMYNKKELEEAYEQLESEHQNEPGFYFDMAEYFFEKKFTDKARQILFDGIEACGGDKRGLKAAAYIFEDWKYFDNAIAIYRGIIAKNPADMSVKRDMALAWYQAGNYQKAVDCYYEIISGPQGNYDPENGVKIVAMNEMNAIIHSKKDSLDLSALNLNLVKHLPVDLRITLQSNYGYMNYSRIRDPKGIDYGSRFARLPENAFIAATNNWDNDLLEYSFRKADSGVYKILVDCYAYNNSSNHNKAIPFYLKVVVFKNNKAGEPVMEVQHISLDNQYGMIEATEIKW